MLLMGADIQFLLSSLCFLCWIHFNLLLPLQKKNLLVKVQVYPLSLGVHHLVVTMCPELRQRKKEKGYPEHPGAGKCSGWERCRQREQLGTCFAGQRLEMDSTL